MDQKIICFGEMLWDVLPTGKMAGGAPMNVAIHLHYQGFHPLMVSRVGSEVSTDWVQVDEVHPTGVVNANVQDRQEVTYDIVMPSAWDFIQTEEALEKLVADSDVFIYGSLAARHDISRQTLLSLLKKARFKIFDVNLRSPHFSQEILELLLQEADVVKLNHHELAEIIRWHGVPADEKTDLQLLRERYKLQLVIVTRGEEGAALLGPEGYLEQAGFQVQVEDTIGSGDAFLATFVSGYLTGLKLPEILRHACAMGALVATRKGATPLVDWKVVEQMVED
jgi:fructokinase